MADDHLLLAVRRLFNESYSRLYWADIQSAVMYSLERSTGLLLSMEWIAILSAPAAAFYLVGIKGIRLAVPPLLSLGLFLGWYAAWRFTRPRWGCQIRTATSADSFPISGRRQIAQSAIELIRHNVAAAQGEMLIVSNTLAPELRVPSLPRGRPLLIVHWLSFGFGLLWPAFMVLNIPSLAPFKVLITIVDVVGLVGTYFAQRRLEFPFVPRSAAVMRIILVFTSTASAYGLFLLGTNTSQVVFSFMNVAISLYGLSGLLLYTSSQSDSRIGADRDLLKIT